MQLASFRKGINSKRTLQNSQFGQRIYSVVGQHSFWKASFHHMNDIEGELCFGCTETQQIQCLKESLTNKYQKKTEKL